MYIPKQAEVKTMVLRAMRDQAPLMYASLRKAGKLNSVADDRASLFEATVGRATVDAVRQRSQANLPFQESLALEEKLLRQAVSQALAEAFEFADENPGSLTA